MNYLTGTVTANIGSWGTAVLRDHARPGTLSGIEFDCTCNTGRVIVNIADGVEVDRAVTGDFNGDDLVNLADALLLLRYARDLFDVNKAINFYGYTEVTLDHVLYALKLLAA